MKKALRFGALLTALLVLLCTALAAPSRLGDNAGLLTASEQKELVSACDRLSQAYGLDVIIATTNDSRGMELRMYAADLVDYNQFRTDNIILVIAMDQRQYTCVTTGAGIALFSDAAIERIYDAMERDMRAGRYAGAMRTFLSCCEQALSHPFADASPRPSPAQASYLQRLQSAALYALLPAFLLSWLIAYLMKHAMLTARPQPGAHSYLSGMQLTRRRDLYLYTTSVRHKIQTDNAPRGGGHGGGGSSTFLGSSGRSHGGGRSRGF